MTGQPSDSESIYFTAQELDALAAICDTLVPAVASSTAPDFFRLRARDLGVPDLMSKAIAAVPDPAQRSGLRQLLGLFENRLVNLLLTRRFHRFSQLPEKEREVYLQGWAHSAISQRRMGFQALKRLACFLFYTAAPNGGNPAWKDMGYPGPAKVAADRPPRLRITEVDTDTDLECDVCIIGSGAGGAVVAAELAASGRWRSWSSRRAATMTRRISATLS